MVLKEGWKGRYYEDFEVGDVYRCPFGRTVIDADNVWFTLLTMNTNQIHFNTEYAKRTEFGKRLVDGTFTFALVTGMSVSDLTMNSVANLGWDEIRLPNPVFEGDTIYEESEVLSKRDSKSRPYAGIVTVLTKGINQKDETVIHFKRTFMVYRQGHSPQNQKT